MQPKIKIISEKKLIGKRMSMTFANNKTMELWRSFMPRRKEIKTNMNGELISMQVYTRNIDYSNFNPHTEFEKWATVEVFDFNAVPTDMDIYTLPAGLYAVFDYTGLNNDTKIFEYIFRTWLPNSIYQLDNRPHFEILSDKYKNNGSDSEEEIWIPIKELRAER
jgi:AraC family transcriptional regulator